MRLWVSGIVRHSINESVNMLEKFWTWLGGLFLVSIIPLLIFITFSAGKDAIVDLAVECEICSNADTCSEAQTQEFVKFIIENSPYKSQRQVQWCLGVDDWANTRVRKGGWILGIMMDVGYVFCPSEQ